MTLSSGYLVSSSTPKLLLGLWSHLSSRRRVQLLLVLLVMLASGVAELLSLGSILPFLVVLSNPDRLWQNSFVQALAPYFGLTEPSQLLLPSTVLFGSAALLAGAVRLINLWLNGRLAAEIGSDLSCQAYQRTLYQPYEVHVKRNSSEVITAITTQINYTVGAINAFLQLSTSVVVASGLFIGLLIIDWSLALFAIAIFGSAYGALAIKMRRELRTNGYLISEASKQQLRALQEGLSAIRDVLLDGSQSFYTQIYRDADRPQRRLLAKNVFLGICPRYSFEALGMVFIAVIGGAFALQQGSGEDVIPLLGTLALGAQRLLPALQLIFQGWALLKGYNSSLQEVLFFLNQPIPPILSLAQPYLLCEGISFESVCFRYEPHQPDVLRGINLHISQGDRIGLIGSSGSGKSTLVDLLMSLLVPTSGRVLVDGIDLNAKENQTKLAAWRASIAHVPQNIYLADGTVSENIAFGIPSDQIDLDRVKLAAAQAQIASFIESKPNGYNSFVGERGISISGGQRQRIGIARALYKNASVLVLDEATSALDSETEAAVMDSIELLSRNLTVIIIAHRLSTISRCDSVIKLNAGEIY